MHADTLRWWEWDSCVGCQVDLTPGRETVSLDFPRLLGPVHWRGPGVAPLAVAAVAKLHGSRAAIDHPGLAVLRSRRGACRAPSSISSAATSPASFVPAPGRSGSEARRRCT
ncbi:MAG: hypothetical protein ACLP50_00180 [Solirubrobacteraceae bacterium]